MTNIKELLKINAKIEEADAAPDDLNPLDFAPDEDTYWRAIQAGDFLSHVYDANEGEGHFGGAGFSLEELLEIVKQAFK